jgi:nucleotide-binding universal stress UspA family protein
VDRLARVIAVPLLIVKSTHAFGEWARAERSLRVVVGADRGAASDAALAFAAQLSTFGPVEVTVAHLWSPKVEQARTGIPAFGEDGTPLPAIEHAVRSRLETQVKAARFEAPPRIEVALEEGRDVSRPLLAMAQEARADLLVLGRKAVGRLAWPGSTVHRTLADAPFSLAVVPRTGPAHPAVEVPQGFRKLLVATDFSELGNSAVGQAVALLPTGGVVHLIYVADGVVTDQARVELLALLEALIPSDAAWLGVHVQPHVLDPAQTDVAIVQAAERFGCELIVLGSHGRSGLRKLLLGGVAEGVVKGADRPVMVVRPKAD